MTMSFWKKIFEYKKKDNIETNVLPKKTLSYKEKREAIDTYWFSNRMLLKTNKIPNFLDDVVLYLWEYTFNPYDVANEYETEQDAYDDHIRHLMSAYGDIIKTVPLEVLYMIGYKNAINCIYLVEQIFDKDLLYNFDNEKEAYTGKFHPKMEKLLIEDLGIQRMFN